MKWLDPPADFFPSDWCTLQTALSHSVVEIDKYRIMIFLSTLTYSQHASMTCDSLPACEEVFGNLAMDKGMTATKLIALVAIFVYETYK